MDSALAWVGQIAEWIGKFIPRWEILNTTMGGVKFVKGSRVVALGPGIHWYWPVTTDFQVYPTARQADSLQSQSIVTADEPERTIVVAGMIVYEVADIKKLIAFTYDPQNTIRDIALSAIHDVCAKMKWEDIKQGQRAGTLDTKLKNEARKALEPYGVNVLKTMLTDLAPARVLRLIQTTGKDGE